MGRSKNESLYDASPGHCWPPNPHSLAWPVGARMRNQGIQPLLSQPIWPKRSPLCSNLPRYSLLEIIQKRGQSQGYRPWLPALKDDISAHFFFILKNGGLWRRSCLACGPDTSPWRWQSPSTYNQTHFQFKKPVPKYHLSAAGKDHTQAANMLRHGQQI